MLKQFDINAEKSFIGGWFIDTEVCDKLVKHFEGSNKKVPGALRGGVDRSAKDCTEIYIDTSVSAVNEYNTHLQEVTNEYLKLYPHAGKTAKWAVSGANIQKYNPSQAYFIYHCERVGADRVSGGRHLVFMTYLNDVTDAGETEFLYQKLKVKPQKGLTLIWPVDWTHTHRGVPSMTQTKYIATGWFSFVE